MIMIMKPIGPPWCRQKTEAALNHINSGGFDFSPFLDIGAKSPLKRENIALWKSFDQQYKDLCRSGAEFVWWIRNKDNPDFLDSMFCRRCNSRLIYGKGELCKGYGLFCSIKCMAEYYQGNPEFRRKREERIDELYGKDRRAIRKKISDTVKSDRCQQETKKTFQRNWGTDHYAKTDFAKNHMVEVCLERYGVTNYTKLEIHKKFLSELQQTKEWQELRLQTMRNNGTLGGNSLEELWIFSAIASIYPDTKFQYRDPRYCNGNGVEYHCDFYIPNLDLFIEYQGYYSHGGCPYDPENDEHQALLFQWQQKGWEGNIHVWTVSDPLKRETARKNGLNWLEFFSIQQVKDWLFSVSPDLMYKCKTCFWEDNHPTCIEQTGCTNWEPKIRGVVS